MKKLLTMIAAAAIGGSSWAAVFPEVEGNDSKATATPALGLMAGDQLTGSSTSSSGAGLDYFLVGSAPAAPGIYRHRLSISPNNLSWTASFRGRTVTAAPADTQAGIPWDGVVGTPTASETGLQSTSSATTPPRFSQWYGFGKAEQLYYRINGGTSTTVPYTVNYSVEPITPVDIGSYAPGQISISTFNQGHSTDTDLWIYDSNFNAIVGYGNDDEGPLGGSPGTGASLQSWLSRNYAPGVYYLALSQFNLVNDQASPSDDDFRTGAVNDFPNSLQSTSSSANVNMAFRITDSAGFTQQIANTKAGAYDVNFFKFTVIPEPASLSLLALAGLLIRRR